MDLVERYIYAVTQKLPSQSREDIGKELRGLIDDMLEERAQGERITEKHIEDVLLELGDPRELALKYRGGRRYVIGPTLFDPFIIVLKITLITVVAMISLGFIFDIILHPPNVLDAFVEFIVGIFTVIPMAFGWVVISFAIIEFLNPDGIKKANVDTGYRFHPADLPKIPDPKGRIKKGEVIAGIVAYMILIAMCSSEYLGIWLFQDGEFRDVIPFFNPDFYGYQLMFILLIFGMGIIKEVLKLIFGRWTMKLVVFTAVVNILSIIGLIVLISIPDIWNPEFMTALVENGLIVEGSETYETVSNIWEGITMFLTILFPLALIWDIVDGLIRVRRSKY